MTKYISSPDNLKLMMNMLKEKSRNIPLRGLPRLQGTFKDGDIQTSEQDEKRSY